MNTTDLEKVMEAARLLPPAESSYLEEDYLMNLQETVLDYQMDTKAVVQALQHYRDHRWDEIRTLEDLEEAFTRFADDKDGNIALAQYLWGYNLWTRAHQLRGLAEYFRSIGIIDQPKLRRWAPRAQFKRDFEGRVEGLGIAVFQWLVMRQGVETIKPDVHIHRFLHNSLGREVPDRDAIDLLEAAAVELGFKAYELDWRIWEASRGGTLPYPSG